MSKVISVKQRSNEKRGDFLKRLKLGSVKYRVREVANYVKVHDSESADSAERELWEMVLREVAALESNKHVAELAREALKTTEISFNRGTGL